MPKKTSKKYYITTAIDYVNARPHIGHAFEKVIADALSRWHKLNEEEVFFLTGTDENAQKNAQIAKEKNIPVKEFVDKNSKIFIELCEKLNISFDRFIRTTEPSHIKKSQELFKKVYEKGDIYKGKYEGLYCVGCEAFKTEKDLINGKCPEHGKAPEKLSEEAYFFKLSKYKRKIEKFIQNYIVPEKRKNEILSRLKEEGLRDLCVSRTNLDWGIDSPIDKKYKIYVWFDALINYISGAEGNWPADLHIIGKGINWFHSVIWPGILLSTGIKLPKKLLVHGYLNIQGEKMSKSTGNIIDAINLIDNYGAETVRYSLFKCSIFDDSDYSEELLIKRHNTELADKLGNLISRVSALAEKHGLEKKVGLQLLSKETQEKVKNYFNNYELDKALNEIFLFIYKCNEYIQEKKPWEEETKDKKKILYELCSAIKDFSILLSPFLPETCEKIAKTFNFDISLESLNKPLKISKIKKAEVLFKKIEMENKKTEPIKNESINNKKVIKPTKIEGIMNTIDFKDWEKIDLRVGKIEKVEDIKDADKLYKLQVNLGSESKTVCAGIKKYYSKEQLEGKKVIIFVNLSPRKMKGIESQGMILAAVSEDESQVVLIHPEKDIKEGSKIR